MRLAPASELTGGLFFDDEGVRSSGHTGFLQRWDLAGPVAEFVDLYLAGYYFQRQARSNVVWTVGAETGQPTEFVTGEPDDRLELLGGRAQPDEELLVYQRHRPGSERGSALLAYDFVSGETHTVAETGDGARRTDFSLITDDHALGRFVDGDVHGIVLLHLDQDRDVDVFAPANAVCRSDRDQLCPRYDHATHHRQLDLILGARPIDHSSYGFFWYDGVNGTEELLLALPRSGEAWQVENLYGLAVSLQDSNGQPLPGLRLGGPVTTFPANGYPRPQQLS